jgi:peptide/nickel transport system permease protein
MIGSRRRKADCPLKRFRTRVSHSAVALAGLAIIVFLMTRLAGNPVTLYLPENATQEQREAFTRTLGLDKPLISQFFRYVRDLVQLDFGTSLSRQKPALDVVIERYPTTLGLAAVTLFVALVLGTIIGCAAALSPGGIFDRTASIVSLAGGATPDFWLAIVGIIVFSVQLGLLPSAGTGGVRYWILPVAVLASRPLGVMVQVVRGAMIGEANSRYVKTAEAKGLRRTRIVMVHTLRNALVPVLTMFGIQAAAIVNGAVVVETIFGWPGVGKLMIDATHERDFPVIQATVIITAIAVFAINAATDVLTTIIDPRTRRPTS